MTDRAGFHAEAALALRQSSIDLPLFDRVQIGLLREAFGSEDLCEMLSQFPEAAGQAVRSIEAALASNDLEEVRRRAHAFKGTASNFGAARLASIAMVLELEATSVDAIVERMPDLADAIDATLAAISGIQCDSTGATP